MSQKRTEDKAKPEFPWTARQRRSKAGTRKVRKQDRNKALKARRIRKKS